MSDLPTILARGEPARLFPVLAETSKEGRSLSIFLACLSCVEEFGRAMFSTIGVRVGPRAKLRTYTEVVLKKGGEKASRPDGLVVVKTGKTEWMALIEAKVGNSDIDPEQVGTYTDLAKNNEIDAIITVSNQFAALPTHHPTITSNNSRKKVALFHWSWMFILTEANLLISNDEIASDDQRAMLSELVRFLTHPSAGVKSYGQMPSSWSNIVNMVQAGGSILTTSAEAKEVIGAWHQEIRDLNLILNRQLSTEVKTRLSRNHARDPTARLKADLSSLAKDNLLQATMVVPDAASPIDICADLQKRSISVSMKLRAPSDRKSTKARVNWLLRQLKRAKGEDIHIRLFWPGRAKYTQYPLVSIREDVEVATTGRADKTVLSFEVLLAKDLAGRFTQRRNFVSALEAVVPEFYDQVGQHLKAWHPPAPRLREAKVEPGSVSPDAIGAEVEQAVMSDSD